MGRSLGVLLVEDAGADAELVLRALRHEGFAPTYLHAADAPTVTAALQRALQQSVAPQRIEVCCKHTDGSYHTLESVCSSLGDGLEATQIIFIAHDITDRNLVAKERLDAQQRLRSALQQTVIGLSAALESRDPYTAGHQRQVALLAVAIANTVGLPRERLNGIEVAATLHDVGKLHIPSEILSKPGRISETEMALIRVHPEVGYQILKGIPFEWPVAQAVLQHHERMDGSGYPAGLAGNDILLEARILGIADTVEAMTARRPYRPALGLEVALREISGGKGRLYDAEVAEACLVLFANGFRLKENPRDPVRLELAVPHPR